MDEQQAAGDGDPPHEEEHSGPDGEEEAGPRRVPARPLVAGLRTLVALVSVAALVTSGAVWYLVNDVQNSANTTGALGHIDQLPGGNAAARPPDDDATDILLVGIDSRTDAQGDPLPAWQLTKLRTTVTKGVNTDTIILLRVPKHGGRAYAISIPRDSYVPIPGLGKHKINAAFGLTEAATRRKLRAEGETDPDTIRTTSETAGRAALAATVQNLTGVHVDHYAEVNLFGFYLLSKAIGGVTVCLRAATRDKDSGASFRAGVQTISGSDALSFVRQRKNLPHGDLDRIQRQQVFLASAAKKLLSAGTLTDPKRLSALAGTARRTLTTDPGLNLVDLLKQAQSLASGRVTFVTIPVVTIDGHSPRGRSIVRVDPKQVRAFVRGLIGGGTDATPPGTAPPTATTSVHPSAYTARRGSTTTEPTPPVTIDGHRCVY